MQKIFMFGVASGLILCSGVASAQLPDLSQVPEIPYDSFSSDVNAKVGNMQGETFDLLDVDGNQKLSRNEISEFAKGILMVNQLSPAEKQSLMVEAEAKFEDFDKDHDNWLDREEGEAYLKDFQEEVIKKQFAKIDSDFSGTLSGNELQNAVQRQNVSLDEAMKSLEDVSAKLKKLKDNPKALADGMIKNVAMQQAGEQFYQMDKDKNDRVTVKEYTDYMYDFQEEQPKNGQQEEKFLLSKEDFAGMFSEMDSERKGYLTKGEYIEKYTDMAMEPVEFDDFENSWGEGEI